MLSGEKKANSKVIYRMTLIIKDSHNNKTLEVENGFVVARKVGVGHTIKD